MTDRKPGIKERSPSIISQWPIFSPLWQIIGSRLNIMGLQPVKYSDNAVRLSLTTIFGFPRSIISRPNSRATRTLEGEVSTTSDKDQKTSVYGRYSPS
jgi:hypothetical protein